MEELIEKSQILKEYLNYSEAKLKIIKLYIQHDLIKIKPFTQEQIQSRELEYATIKACLNERYNFLVSIANCKYAVDSQRTNRRDKIGAKLNLCNFCQLDKCIKTDVFDFVATIEIMNKTDNLQIEPLDVINYMLKTKKQELTECTEDIFKEIEFKDLLLIEILLESELVSLIEYNEETKIAKYKYVNLEENEIGEIYINKIYNYYNNKEFEIYELNVEEFTYEMKENETPQMYKIRIASYYEYLIKIKKIDVLKSLLEYIKEDKKYNIKTRSRYFLERYKQKILDLPHNESVKKKLLEIYNYVVNYNYIANTPLVPINIVLYTSDKEIVKNIGDLIGEVMWFFGYLSDDMKWYDESMNSIILDKFYINKLYNTNINGNVQKKKGILTINNFENILYTEEQNRDLILNILTNQIEKNNRNVCTIIYGEKEILKPILESYPKLNNILFNLKIDLEELDHKKLQELLVEKLEKTDIVTDEVKNKLLNYIKVTYDNSEIKNMEYVNNLYNQLILNKNRKLNIVNRENLGVDDIPEAYNTKDSQDILKDLKKLVGLEKIKQQINDLVCLLKFNKKANLNISKFNLHMMFSGNPGTGKTTVARIVSSILYKLGYIQQDKLIEVSAKDLIASYVGQTAGKTYAAIKSAMGGVLFIDEAYAINTSGNNSFGEECIATLIKAMEDYKDKLVVIFAGYEKEMEDFIDKNPGFRSRVGYKINFEDYSTDELMEIFDGILVDDNLKIEDLARIHVSEIVEKARKIKDFGNGRYIHKMYQNIIIEHAKNTQDLEEKDERLFIITEDDIVEDKLIEHSKNEKRIGF